MNKRQHTQRGFTLIETLVGIAILILAVTATLTIVSTNLSISGSSREQVTAFFLAQEAIEIIRNTRDNNSIAGDGWLSGLTSCFGASPCKIDATELNSPASSCGASGCQNLKINSEGVYQYTSGPETVFNREINITRDPGHPNREAVVEVVVSWMDGARERDFTIEENIFNWQQ